jgi:ABC-type branched-subunit amino acid transport system substrate-binding protein
VAGQAELVEALAPAGVPVLSLSARGGVEGATPGTWVRLVAPLEAQAAALAETVPTLRRARRGVCVVAAPSDGTTFARTVVRSLPEDLAVTEAPGPAAVAEAACGVAIWTGGAEGGAGLAASIASAGSRPVTLVGGPSLRDPVFLELAGGSAEGSVSVCSCADVSTSLDLAAQRFVQDFQSQFGSPPAPFAVEGWDAAHLLVRALREAGPTRADVRRWLAIAPEVEGLGGAYALAGGELVDPESAIRRYRVEGGRWVEAAPSAGA